MTSKSRNLLIVGFVLAVLAILVISQMIERPDMGEQDMFAQAKTQLAETASAKMRLEIETSFQPSALTGQEEGVMESLNLPLSVSGPFDLSYPVGGSVSGQSELDFSAGMGLVQLMKLSLRLTDDGAMYAQAQDLPDDTGLQVSFQGVEDAWFSFAGGDLLRLMPWLAKDDNPSAAPALPISADVLRSSVGRWLSVQERQADTALVGQAAAHFELAVDEELLAEFLSDLTGELRGNAVSVQERATISEFVQSRRWLAEAWISQKSGHLMMLKLGIFPQDDVEGQAVSLTLAFGEFNQPIEPAAPEQATPLSAVLDKMPNTVGR